MINKQFRVDGIDYSKTVYGLLCGRFQPLHYGHFEFIDRSLDYVDSLIVGITNPNITKIIHTNFDYNRCKKESNIFSFEERKLMVSGLFSRYFNNKLFRIVPFELNTAIDEVSNLPDNLLIMHTVYDTWGEEKRRLFEMTGKKYVTIWNRTNKITTGSEIRSALKGSSLWEHLVPQSTRIILEKIGLENIKSRFK